MAYTISLADSASRQLAALPRWIRRSLRKEILALATDPRRPRSAAAAYLWGEWEGYWRLRVGEHRVIYEIDDRAQQVRVERIGHRSTVYERRGDR